MEAGAAHGRAGSCSTPTLYSPAGAVELTGYHAKERRAVVVSALLHQDVPYMVRNPIVSTFDPETGKLLRQERVKDALGDYYASPVAGEMARSIL